MTIIHCKPSGFEGKNALCGASTDEQNSTSMGMWVTCPACMKLLRKVFDER